jgi:3-hydroxyisobutyrate dehydrogenase
MNTAISKPRVALFGLGLMGSGMARRLLGAGFPLAIYNRSAEKAAPLAADGAEVAATPGEAAAKADIVLSMVADDTASRAVWLGKQGALATVARGTVLVESSTLTVAWVNELAEAAAERGCELLDAPVTGTKSHAASGEMLFLVGGSARALEKARPVLAVLSRAIVHVGANGSGALLKLVNNFLCGVQTASWAEALALIERGGLDHGKAVEVLLNGAPGSPMLKTISARIAAANDYAPNFVLSLMAKDLRYALGEGQQRGLSMPTVTAALELFSAAEAAGLGGKDFAAVAEVFRQRVRGGDGASKG